MFQISKGISIRCITVLSEVLKKRSLGEEMSLYECGKRTFLTFNILSVYKFSKIPQQTEN